MTTRTVYRLEASCGTGCFRAASVWDYSQAAVENGLIPHDDDNAFHSASRGFPGPFGDGILDDAEAKGLTWNELNCGFESLDQAREWFPPELTSTLERFGQELTVWEVDDDDVAVGGRQVMFDRAAAHLAQRLPASALHDGSI